MKVFLFYFRLKRYTCLGSNRYLTRLPPYHNDVNIILTPPNNIPSQPSHVYRHNLTQLDPAQPPPNHYQTPPSNYTLILHCYIMLLHSSRQKTTDSPSGTWSSDVYCKAQQYNQLASRPAGVCSTLRDSGTASCEVEPLKS